MHLIWQNTKNLFIASKCCELVVLKLKNENDKVVQKRFVTRLRAVSNPKNLENAISKLATFELTKIDFDSFIQAFD